MALTISAPNFKENNILERATVGKDSLDGQPVVTFDNAQNFVAHDYVLLGRPGSSKSRIYQILSVTGETVTLTENLEFYAERGMEITKLFGNQIKIYTAPYVSGQTPTSFTALSGGVVAIDPDQLSTNFTDTTGSDQVWYKFTYYNAYNSGETPLADSTAVRDTRSTDYCSIDAIRHEAGFDGNADVTDEDLQFHRQAAQAEINGALAGKYQLPFTQPLDMQIVNIARTLAAGYAMISEYGTFDGMDKTKGEKKRDDARAQLKLLQDGTSVLTGADAVSDVLPDAGGFSSGYSSDSPAMFAKDDIAGYNSRAY